MDYFKNKVIWITGASSGIGEALAYHFSSLGAQLLLSSRRVEELQRVRNACAHPEQVKILPLDLLDSASIEGQTKSAIAQFGQIDICILNAGISQRSLVVDTSLEVHRRVMELDYFSCVELSRHLLPHFLGRKSGHFVAMSSVMGKLGTPMRSSYAAAKHALHGFFDCLRAEVSGRNIKVTLLTPGYIRTNISLNALKGDGSKFDIMAENIKTGLPSDQAARQMARAIAEGRYESYIGRFGGERIGLWINRIFPSFIIKRAPKLVPK
jgi:dehydrogenase/reductase SDR family protein 7B